jgi:hypothetical protein
MNVKRAPKHVKRRWSTDERKLAGLDCEPQEEQMIVNDVAEQPCLSGGDTEEDEDREAPKTVKRKCNRLRIPDDTDDEDERTSGKRALKRVKRTGSIHKKMNV